MFSAGSSAPAQHLPVNTAFRRPEEIKMTPRSALRTRYVVAALFLAAGMSAAPAFAQHVMIGGTHSKDEIKAACDKVGGINIEGQGGKGYGCFNQNKNTMVACDNSGQCSGFVPGKGH
jgi:hypothetical protein